MNANSLQHMTLDEFFNAIVKSKIVTTLQSMQAMKRIPTPLHVTDARKIVSWMDAAVSLISQEGETHLSEAQRSFSVAWNSALNLCVESGGAFGPAIETDYIDSRSSLASGSMSTDIQKEIIKDIHEEKESGLELQREFERFKKAFLKLEASARNKGWKSSFHMLLRSYKELRGNEYSDEDSDEDSEDRTYYNIGISETDIVGREVREIVEDEDERNS